MPTRVTHWHRATWPEYLFALALIAAPLALGSVHVVAQIGLAALLLAAFAGAWWMLAREGREVRVGWVGVGLFVALGWSFVQWLPLPASLVEVLSPTAYATRRVVAQLAGLEPPAWMPLTLDAGRTAAAIVSLLAVTLAYLTATSLRPDSDARLRITSYIELSALGVLFSAVVHHALDLTAIWGFYTPVTSSLPGFVTSFVNPNHAAALMLLGAVIAFGASLAPERSRWHLAIGVALSVGVLLSMSRANALLLVVALFLVTLPPLCMPRFRADRGRLLRLLLGALACLFIALVLIGPERWAVEFAALDDKGLAGQGVFTYCWTVARDVMGVAPWVGVGAGSFGVAATPFIDSWSHGYLAYAHHGIAQVLSDLGLVVGSLVLLLVAAGFLRAAVRGLRGTSAELPLWAAAVALLALGLQNLVDFSLWIPGVGVPAAAALGLVVEWAWETRRATEPGWLSPAWRWPLWAIAIPFGMLVVTAVPAHRDRPESWKAEALSALATKAHEEVDAIDRAELATQHPHDYLALQLTAALADASGQHAEARGWLEQALALAPNEPTTVEAAIRQRLAHKDQAAALELIDRLDPRGEGQARAVALVLDAPWARTLHEGFFGKDPRRAIAAARDLAGRKQPEAADALIVWALARWPHDLRLYDELVRRRWNDGVMLARIATTCLSEAGSLGPAGVRWERLGDLAQARALALEGSDVAAYHLYLAAADAVPEDGVPALIEAGKLAQKLVRADWMDDALARLGELDVEGAWPRGEYYFLRSVQREWAGDVAGAIREMHEVVRTLGHVPGMHDRLAELYQRSGDAEAANRARGRARALEAAP